VIWVRVWASSASCWPILLVRSLIPGGELGGAGLGDLVAESSLDFCLEPVPLVAGAAELGSRELEVGGQAGGAGGGSGPLLACRPADLDLACGLDVLVDAFCLDEPVRYPGGAGDAEEGAR
jgi:hypothetical protein